MFFRHITGYTLCCLLLTVVAVQAQPNDTAQHIVAGGYNSSAQQAKPYVILISIDGFRHDYATKYHADNLLRLSRQGVRASSMTPSFPSFTFPNHYTIVTGLYPAHHGLVGNTFYDRARKVSYLRSDTSIAGDPYYYGGKPLWVLAEQQQLISAVYYWVGSEVAIDGVHPTYYYDYSEKVPLEARLGVVKQWLQLPAATRPHLIHFYISEVDSAGHHFGPDHPLTIQAIHKVDRAIGQLTSMLDSLHLPINYVMVSDHGMTGVDTTQVLTPPTSDMTRWMMVASDVMVQYYAKDSNAIPAFYQQLKRDANGYDVYLRNETPAHWHYGERDDRYNRIGDILLIARYPQIFSWTNRRVYPGRHGYDPRLVKDMQASFMAWGPAIKKQKKPLASFENIHVYTLITQLLGLTVDHPVDSEPGVLRKILR
ncbi:ectonucleotide pyrophosphatase/phosphodiesterase [Paraflavitalea pollutisoli]|uniref:alkaline phosphatase family protein n=1 Tax=Paraflavitalea pollutisoli TaxID=3034143 RepID=UPI0023EBAA86|nr:ectonucleotide pyrophosphatase/phosphodiesterase [Paraflavitalea sp. H1-2-19X]